MSGEGPERRVADALLARAEVRGPAPARPGVGRHGGTLRTQVGTALVVALLAGAVLGMGLALLSVLVPGLLPAIG